MPTRLAPLLLLALLPRGLPAPDCRKVTPGGACAVKAQDTVLLQWRRPTVTKAQPAAQPLASAEASAKIPAKASTARPAAGALQQDASAVETLKARQPPACQVPTPCPADWAAGPGGYFCPTSRGCRPLNLGMFPDCEGQCRLGAGAPPASPPAAPTDPLSGTASPPLAPSAPGEWPQCGAGAPCPAEWRTGAGGFFCPSSNGCRPVAEGPFPVCEAQCFIGAHPQRKLEDSTPAAGAAFLPRRLEAAGTYDLRVFKNGRLVGCAAPVGLFAGNEKYGCGGRWGTAQACDAAKHPVRDTKYVKAVHAGCLTAQGKGTYAYAYDDGVGLRQCAPVTKYEWILCPDGDEGPIRWEAVAGKDPDTVQRFRVINKCAQPVWIQMVPALEDTVRIEPGAFHSYAIPNKGLPSMRYLPKMGCDTTGNACDIQSMPPCPPQGCDAPIETKFEASWGCRYATGSPEDKDRCTLTAQGNPSTYQDWWDGSAVDGWTLPFSVLVNNEGHGLSPFDTSGQGSPQCQAAICDDLEADTLCPVDEYLTPES